MSRDDTYLVVGDDGSAMIVDEEDLIGLAESGRSFDAVPFPRRQLNPPGSFTRAPGATTRAAPAGPSNMPAWISNLMNGLMSAQLAVMQLLQILQAGRLSSMSQSSYLQHILNIAQSLTVAAQASVNAPSDLKTTANASINSAMNTLAGIHEVQAGSLDEMQAVIAAGLSQVSAQIAQLQQVVEKYAAKLHQQLLDQQLLRQQAVTTPTYVARKPPGFFARLFGHRAM